MVGQLPRQHRRGQRRRRPGRADIDPTSAKFVRNGGGQMICASAPQGVLTR